MLASTSSMMWPSAAQIVPNFMIYPPASAIRPLRQHITLSAIAKASGPLTLITDIAPVPGTVAGAYIVSSFRMYISFGFRSLRLASLAQDDSSVALLAQGNSSVASLARDDSKVPFRSG